MQTQRHLKIFISSTFQDMDEEREILLKNTFLELKKIAKSRDVEVTEIDLRTGITKEQAENGQIVKICLDEVERCADSPIFFLGILGNRYGSVDWLGDVSDNILEDKKYSWITDFSNRSLTEIEIILALERNEKHNRAFIYLKDGEDDNEKLTNLRNRLIAKSKNNSHIEVTNYKDSSEFRIQTIESFTKALDELYPKDKKLSELDKLKNSHQIFAKSRQKVYISHAKNEAILSEFVANDEDRLLLYGESGYGKSALIANYFEKFKQDNDSFVIEHYIGGAGELSNDLHQMLRRIMLEIKEEFNLPQEVPTEPQKIIDEFAPWLYLVKRPTIIILDGYNQIEDELKEKLFYYIPEKLEKVKLIISSIKDNYPIDNKYKIEPLSKEEKQELIIDYLTHYGKGGMALKIYNHISTHPQTDNTLFLRTLLNEIRLLGNFDNIENDINNYLQAKDVVGLFIKIFERLESDYRTNLAQEVLSLIYVSRDGLSEDNLMEIINQNSKHKLTRLDFSPLFLALEEHLINKNGLYGFFHDYIREAVKNRYLNSLELINIERRKIADYFEKREIDNQMVRELPYQLFEMGDRDRLYKNLVDIDFFIEVYKKNEYELLKYVELVKVNSSFFKELENKSFKKDVNNLLGLTSFYIHIYSDDKKSLEYSKKVLEFIVNKYGENHDSILSSYNNLGMSYLPFSAKKSIQYLKKAISKTKIQTELSYIYHNLGRAYRKNGEYENSLKIYNKTLDIKYNFFGKESLEVASAYSDISELYKEIGKYDLALEYLQKSHKILENSLGKTHIDTSISCVALGALYKDLGLYEKSLELIKVGIEIQESIYREKHPELLTSYGHLAEVYRAMDKLDESLKIYQNIFDEKNNYSLSNLRHANNLGESYREKGIFDKAIKIHDKVLEIRLKNLGESHLDTISSYNNLALTYYHVGNLNKSKDLYEKALEICLDKYKNTIDTMMLLHNLSGIYSELGNYWKALSLINQSLEVAKKVFEKNHPYIAMIYNTLGVCYGEMEYYDKALIELEKSLKIRLEKLGLEHSDTQGTITSIENVKSLKAEKYMRNYMNSLLNKE